MAIVYTKVTWYSKLLALIVLVAFPFIAFWLGVRYGEVRQRASEFVPPAQYQRR